MRHQPSRDELDCLSIPLTAVVVAALVSSAGFAQGPRGQTAAAGRVTFSETIAPIVYANCVTCHRPGEAAPFSLISYDDVKKRGELMATVTKSRYMPPWHAAHGYGEFADERRLTDAQIATIGEWVKQGMPQGNPARMPPLPQFTEGWHLGKPDLILEMPVAFNVPAGGPDIYRNFAIPTGLTEDKWVRAVEFRPTARKAVHHALFAYVRSGAMKDFEGKDGKPGFVGVNGLGLGIGIQPNFQPSGGLGGWAVGTTPAFLSDGQAWPLAKGTDLVLQMHFHPTGKPETERSIVGLYFADQAPDRRFSNVGLPTLFGLVERHRHQARRQGLHDPRLDDAARRRARLFRDGARALPGQGDEGHGDAARRLDAAAALDSGLGLQLAGPLRLQAAAVAAEGHADRRQHPLRQFGGQPAQSEQSAEADRCGASNRSTRWAASSSKWSRFAPRMKPRWPRPIRRERERRLPRDCRTARSGGSWTISGERPALRRAFSRSRCWIVKGKSSRTVAEPGVYNQAALSPDGTRVAVIRTDLESAGRGCLGLRRRHRQGHADHVGRRAERGAGLVS